MKSVALPNSPARALQPRAPWRWAVIGAAIGLVAAFVLFAPAAWVARGVHHWSGGQLWLHETSGTWWQGSARVALTSGPTGTDRTRLPGRLHWRLTPGWSSGPDAEAGLRGPLARLRGSRGRFHNLPFSLLTQLDLLRLLDLQNYPHILEVQQLLKNFSQ